MLLILIGREEAAGVLRYLEEDEVERLTQEIASIDRVTDREATQVLEEFGMMARERRGVARGGMRTAREFLSVSLGEERGEELLERVRKKVGPNFRFMEDVEPDQAAALLANESAAVTAAVLSQIDPAQAAEVLSRLSSSRRGEVAARIARLSRLSPDVLERVHKGLRDKLETQGRMTTRSVDGRQALARILAHLPQGEDERLVEGIAESDPEAAAELRKRVLAPDLILRAVPTDLQGLLREVDDRTLALALKGRTEDIREKLLQAVSTRRRERVAEEGQTMGPVPRSEADAAFAEILELAQRLREEGRLRVEDSGEELVE